MSSPSDSKDLEAKKRAKTTQLMKAIQEQDMESIDKILANPDQIDYACSNAEAELIEEILNHDVNVTLKNQHGQTLMHLMLDNEKLKHEEVSKLYDMFVEKGGNINERDNNGNTILHMSANIGLNDVTNKILNNLNAHQKLEALLTSNEDDNLTPLMLIAARTEQSEDLTEEDNQEALNFILDILNSFNKVDRKKLLLFKNNQGTGIWDILFKYNPKLAIEFLTSINLTFPNEEEPFTQEELLEIYQNMMDFSFLIKMDNTEVLNHLFSQVKEAIQSLLLIRNPEKNLISMVLEELSSNSEKNTKKDQLVLDLLDKLTPTERMSALLWEGDPEISPLMILIVSHQFILLNKILSFLNKKPLEQEVLLRGKEAIIEALEKQNINFPKRNERIFKQRIANTSALKLFKRGEEEGMIEKFAQGGDRTKETSKLTTVNEDLTTALEDPLILSPLAKNQYTYDLEKIVKYILRGASNRIDKDPDTGECYITFSLALKTEKYNLSKILKYANKQHIKLDQEDMKNYDEFIHSSSSLTPKFKDKAGIPTAQDFEDKIKGPSLKNTSYAERMAINIYTGGYYREMSDCLEGKLESYLTGGYLNEYLLHSVMACSGLNKTPDVQLKTAYRWEKSLKEPGVQIENKFSSTSLGQPQYKFYKPPTTKAAVMFTEGLIGKDIHEISEYPGENEFLCPPMQVHILSQFQIKDESGHPVTFYKAKAVRTLSNLPEDAQLQVKNYSEANLNTMSTVALIFLENIKEIEKNVRAKNYNPALLGLLTEAMQIIDEKIKSSMPMKIKFEEIESLLKEIHSKIQNLPNYDSNILIDQQKKEMIRALQKEQQTLMQTRIDTTANELLWKMMEPVVALVKDSSKLFDNETLPPIKKLGLLQITLNKLIPILEQKNLKYKEEYDQFMKNYETLLSDDSYNKLEKSEAIARQQKLKGQILSQWTEIQKAEEAIKTAMALYPVLRAEQEQLNAHIRERLNTPMTQGPAALMFAMPKKREIQQDTLEDKIQRVVEESVKFNESRTKPETLLSLKEQLGLKEEKVLKVSGEKILVNKDGKNTWLDIPTLYKDNLNKPTTKPIA